jgi:hypothetical protein
MFRHLLVTMVLCATPTFLAAADHVLTAEDLYGRWAVDEKAATKDQADAVAAAKQVDGFGVVLTARFARLTFSADDMTAGLWRLDDAHADSATLVVQPKGGEERHFSVQVKGDHLTVAEMPGKLPLARQH